MKAPNIKYIKRFYGNPYGGSSVNKKWYAENIISVDLPFPMRLAWSKGTVVTKCRFHKKVAQALQSALKCVWNEARIMVKIKHGYNQTTEFYDRETLKLLKSLNLDLFGGTFNYRLIRGSSVSLSSHAYGVAIDIDPENNQLGSTKFKMPNWVVKCFKKEGFTWGGDFKRKDAMHFEMVAY